jgi:hypothetical protein
MRGEQAPWVLPASVSHLRTPLLRNCRGYEAAGYTESFERCHAGSSDLFPET